MTLIIFGDFCQQVVFCLLMSAEYSKMFYVFSAWVLSIITTDLRWYQIRCFGCFRGMFLLEFLFLSLSNLFVATFVGISLSFRLYHNFSYLWPFTPWRQRLSKDFLHLGEQILTIAFTKDTTSSQNRQVLKNTSLNHSTNSNVPRAQFCS